MTQVHGSWPFKTPGVDMRPALVLERQPATSAVEPLLRRRLIIVALLATLTSAFFSRYRSALPGQWQFFRESRFGTELLVFEGVIFVTGLVSAALLWRRRDWSLRSLRVVEFALVSLFAVYIAWSQLFAWSGSRVALGVSPAADAFTVRLAVDSMAGRWVALIVGISTLVPETWRRNAAIVGLLACTAIGVTTFMAMSDAAYRPHLGAMLTLMLFWMVVASTIAIFGSYKLAELRQQVHDARKLGQYRLVRRIGAGGMGEVYLAEHVMLKQRCAIKVIRPELAGDPSAMQRFEREVRATSRLKHWNTVQIYDYGYADDGTFYYAMEYLPGVTLQQLVLQHGPLPPGRAVRFLRQVCGALREAHSMELIHRDIKPANIIACERGGLFDVAKLLDFGMVRRVGHDSRAETLTSADVLVGTPAYMSPEQVRGGSEMDARSDIYSVGAVGYFLLTGQPPFQRDTSVQVLMAHLNDVPAPPGTLRAGVSADLDAVLMRCLSKDPRQRFPDAHSLDEALAHGLSAGTWTDADAEAWWRLHALPDGQQPAALADRETTLNGVPAVNRG